MGSNKKSDDFFQSDLSWLDDSEESLVINKEKPASFKSTKKKKGPKVIEIAGQVITLTYVKSPQLIEGYKVTSQKLKGVRKSDSHVAAIRKAAALRRGIPNGKAGIPLSEIHKQRIGDGNRGVSRPTVWKGKKHSEETKEKIRQHNLNRDPSSYTYSEEKKVAISNSISAGKKGKNRSPEMMAKMAEQRAMNFKTPIGVFRTRQQASQAYVALGYSGQDFKKFCKFNESEFHYSNDVLTVPDSRCKKK